MAVVEADYMPPTNISAKVYEILARLRQGLPIHEEDKALLLSTAETSLILSQRKGSLVSIPSVYKLKHYRKLVPEVEGPPRYRLEDVLNYTFEPPGPKPHSRRHNG